MYYLELVFAEGIEEHTCCHLLADFDVVNEYLAKKEWNRFVITEL